MEDCSIASEKATRRRSQLLRQKERPERVGLHIHKIPKELKQLGQWMNWSWVRNGGRWTKKPCSPTAGSVSWNDKSTWLSFEDALANLNRQQHISGIGLVLGEGLVGVDLDGCLDESRLTPGAAAIATFVNSYTEISPSGTGLKAFALGEGVNIKPKLGNKSVCEFFSSKKFFTVTGNVFQDMKDLGDFPKSEQINALMQMIYLPVADGEDGSNRLIKYARIAVENDLDAVEGVEVIEHVLSEIPTPKNWSTDEIERRFEDALKRSSKERKKSASKCFVPDLVPFSEIEARSVEWLWPNRIALGRLTILAGVPGGGKSFATCDIASRVSRGSAWPDFSPGCKGKVIMVCAEDNPHDTIRPRLDAQQAELSQVLLLKGGKPKEDGQLEECFTLENLQLLENAIIKHPDCRLVIIDPIGSFIGRIDSHKDNEVRSVLGPLCTLAERHNFAVLMVAHVAKGAYLSADSAVLGSRAFTGLARNVWHLRHDQNDKGRRLFLSGKSNLAKESSGLAFKIEEVTSRLVWESEAIDMDADEAIGIEQAKPAKERAPTRAAAASWLLAHLSQQWVLANDVKDAAKRHYAEATLKRAFEQLEREGKVVSKGGKGKGNPSQWKLSDQANPGSGFNDLNDPFDLNDL